MEINYYILVWIIVGIIIVIAVIMISVSPLAKIFSGTFGR